MKENDQISSSSDNDEDHEIEKDTNSFLDNELDPNSNDENDDDPQSQDGTGIEILISSQIIYW